MANWYCGFCGAGFDTKEEIHEHVDEQHGAADDDAAGNAVAAQRAAAMGLSLEEYMDGQGGDADEDVDDTWDDDDDEDEEDEAENND